MSVPDLAQAPLNEAPPPLTLPGPAEQASPAQAPPPGPQTAPEMGITATQAAPPPVRFEPAARDSDSAALTPASLHPPRQPRDVRQDPESGDYYQAFELAGHTYRAAVMIPADFEMEVTRMQAALPRDEKTGLIASTGLNEDQASAIEDLVNAMLNGAVWDEDIPDIRARMRDKRRPVNTDALMTALNFLWGSYKAEELGKGPTG